MMKYSKGRIAAAILVILVSSMGTLQAGDLQDGFMGIPWKSDLSGSADFVKIDQEGDITALAEHSRDNPRQRHDPVKVLHAL